MDIKLRNAYVKLKSNENKHITNAIRVMHAKIAQKDVMLSLSLP